MPNTTTDQLSVPATRAERTLTAALLWCFVSTHVIGVLPMSMSTASAAPTQSIQPPLSVPAYEQEKTQDPMPPQSAGPTPMGATRGEFEVDESGAARYSVPLEVLPGIGGLQPQVSLAYASSAGNGVLGVGFAVSGVSSITRCPYTIADEGEVLPVRLGSDDHFCLDGAKLVLYSGQYGANAAEYRTRPDDQVRVRSYGGTPGGEGPEYFLVELPNGLKQYYGRRFDGTLDATRIAVGSSTFKRIAWSLSYVRDGSDNTIRYDYGKRTIAPGTEVERWIESIRYGQANTADRRVYFEVEDRPDTRVGYRFGAPLELTKRFKRISIEKQIGSWQVARSYTLSYEPETATSLSLLKEIKQCGRAASDCRRPTKFGWQHGSNEAFANGTKQLVPLPASPATQIFTADFNGDGRLDIAYPVTTQPNGSVKGNWQYALSKPTSSPADHYLGMQTAGQAVNGAQQLAYLFDYNLDGLTDLTPRACCSSPWTSQLSKLNSDGSVSIVKATTDFFGPLNQAPGTTGALFGDFNGDGLQDNFETRYYEEPQAGHPAGWRYWVRLRTGKVHPSLDVNFSDHGSATPHDALAFESASDATEISLNGAAPEKLRIVDIDGDGRDELLYVGFVSGTTQRILAKTPRAPNCPGCFDTKLPPQVMDFDTQWLDLNGDGLTDLITNGGPNHTTPTASLYYWLNTGAGFAPAQALGMNRAVGSFKAGQVLDVDGDGRDELLLPRLGGILFDGIDILRSTVSPGQLSFAIEQPAALTFHALVDVQQEQLATQGYRIGDVNGDGLPDILAFLRDGATSPGVHLYRHQGLRPALLTTVYESYPGAVGSVYATYEVKYAPLTHAQVYSRGNCERIEGFSCAFGAARQVVRQLRRDMGLNASAGPNEGMELISDYSYTGGRYDRTTGAFVGFAEQRVTSTAGVGPQIDGTRNVLVRRFYDVTEPGRNGKLEQEWRATRYAAAGQPERIAWERTRHDWQELETDDAQEQPVSYFRVIRQTDKDSFDLPVSQFSCAQQDCLAALSLQQVTQQLGNAAPVRRSSEQVQARDGYGNVLHTSTTYGGGQDEVTEVVHVPAVDQANWLIRRVGETRVTESTRDVVKGTVRVQSLKTQNTYRPSGAGINAMLPETTVESAADSKTLTTRYVYTPAGEVERITQRGNPQELPREVTVKYDEHGYVHAVRTGFENNTVYTGFDSVTGQLAVLLDQNGVGTDYTYDTLGRLLEVRSLQQPRSPSAGIKQRLSYTLQSVGNEQLLQVESSDESGALSRRLFDRGGRTIRASFKGFDGVMRERKLSYDVYGRLLQAGTYKRQSTSEPEYFVTYAYDNLDRIVKSIDPGNGSPATRTWKYEGLKTTYTDARGMQSQTSYDVRGRRFESIDALNVADQKVMRRYGYAPFDRLATSELFNGQGQLIANTRSSYSYDPFGNLLTRVDAERGTSSYEYNAFDEPVSITDASARLRRFEYDLRGRLLSEAVTQNGTLLSQRLYTYDSIAAPNARTTIGALLQAQFTEYELPGALSGLQHTSDYYYDSYGRITTREYRMPSDVAPGPLEMLSFTTGYDGLGRVSTLTFPKLTGQVSPTKIQYEYAPDTSNGRVQQVRAVERLAIDPPVPKIKTLWTARATDSQDRLSEFILGSTHGLNSYDWLGRSLTTRVLTHDADQGPSNLALVDLSYDYDAEGNLAARSDLKQNVTEHFGYDALDRVAVRSRNQATLWSAPEESFKYDLLGNLAQSTHRGVFAFHADKPLQLKTVTGSSVGGNGTYEYDLLGRQKQRPDGSVSYNSCDKPMQFSPVADGPTPPTLYLYDAGCKRVQRTTARESVVYAENYERHLNKSTGEIEHRLLVGGATLRYRQQGTSLTRDSTLYASSDRLGSTALVTRNKLEASGEYETEVVEQRAYDAFGLRRNPNLSSTDIYGGIQPATLDQGYTGHTEDLENGTIYMRGRMYDPKLARFTTADPFVTGSNPTQRWNRYAYVSNNPLKYTDPSGFAEDIDHTPSLPEMEGGGGGTGTTVATGTSAEKKEETTLDGDHIPPNVPVPEPEDDADPYGGGGGATGCAGCQGAGAPEGDNGGGNNGGPDAVDQKGKKQQQEQQTPKQKQAEQQRREREEAKQKALNKIASREAAERDLTQSDAASPGSNFSGGLAGVANEGNALGMPQALAAALIVGAAAAALTGQAMISQSPQARRDLVDLGKRMGTVLSVDDKYKKYLEDAARDWEERLKKKADEIKEKMRTGKDYWGPGKHATDEPVPAPEAEPGAPAEGTGSPGSTGEGGGVEIPEGPKTDPAPPTIYGPGNLPPWWEGPR